MVSPKRFTACLLVSFAALLCLVWGTSSLAADSSSAALVSRLNRLERDNAALRSRLNLQEDEIRELRQAVVSTQRPVAQLQQEVPQVRSQVAQLQQKEAAEAAKPKQPDFSVGFRSGWAESPYDLPGGFFWGAYIDHLLLSREEGAPNGDLSGEFFSGIIQGTHKAVAGTGAAIFADTLMFQPTVKYQFDLDGAPWFKPYILGGPGMYVTMIGASGASAIKFKPEIPNFQAGYTGGAGFRLSLAQLNLNSSLLDRTSLGAEWRYNGLANGEQFQAYSGSLSVGF